jgi:hypothetical protein
MSKGRIKWMFWGEKTIPIGGSTFVHLLLRLWKATQLGLYLAYIYVPILGTAIGMSNWAIPIDMDMALHHSSTPYVCILNTHFYLPPLGQVFCAALFLAQQIHTFDVNITNI